MAEDNAVVSAKEKKHSVKDLGAAGTEFLRNHKHIYTRHRKKILVFFLCIVAVILWVLVFNLRKYDDFDVKETYERVDSAETHYVDFQDNFLKYSRDGAFYTEYDGDLIWNYTYEMDDPQIDVCGNYILIYDVQGTQAAILTNTGFKQTIKTAMPIVDARLENGDRVNIVLPPVAVNGPIITIRRFPKEPITMERLIELGSVSKEVADFLKQLVCAGYNIFICGGTGSGKTTFLNALSDYIPKDERIITIEDNAELQIQGVENLVRLEARKENTEGKHAVTIRDLIKSRYRNLRVFANLA